ncbi:MAG: exosortase-dependent surface protein XDP2 [Cyanobacteria bacterium P01_H01_bin.58]
MYSSPFKIVTAAGATVGCLLLSSTHVGAATFSFVTNTSINNAPTGDVLLDSVTYDGDTISDFVFVDDVTIVENDAFVGPDTGAASTDKGDDVTTPGATAEEDPTAAQILGNLANNNLNSIVDTEEEGSFILDLDFGQVVDTLFLWERGGNSILGLQALDIDGNLLGSAVTVDSSAWDAAGFSIDTTEIEGVQPVVSLGIDAPGFFSTDDEIAGVRVFSESVFNGPDWKIVASGDIASIPEPAAVLGLAAFAGAFYANRGRRQTETDA